MVNTKCDVSVVLNRTWHRRDITYNVVNSSVDVLYPYTHELKIIFQVFHVRSVTQGDVIRADAKEIPRIFQVIFPPCLW